jgi:hypothetical protein
MNANEGMLAVYRRVDAALGRLLQISELSPGDRDALESLRSGNSRFVTMYGDELSVPAYSMTFLHQMQASIRRSWEVMHRYHGDPDTKIPATLIELDPSGGRGESDYTAHGLESLEMYLANRPDSDGDEAGH